MKRVMAIVGGGPKHFIPELKKYDTNETFWIGADQGAETIIEHGLTPDIAIGDFDSVSASSFDNIKRTAQEVLTFPDEKDETDLELALGQALERRPDHILLFGVTGGRLDHSMANLQLLYPIRKQGILATIIDVQNQVELVEAGEHKLGLVEDFPYVSFLPVTLEVRGITLNGFYYPLEGADLPYGSTRCISNQLIEEEGTFSFRSGILLVIRSRDLMDTG
ncbi:thiamine diphosphokinase [Halobacillus fulvus]|nr:thiamine diphosphokinase [Halobacillus fulvus]